MSYIFIRHDKKNYNNGKCQPGVPRFDPPIDYSQKSPHEEMLRILVPTKIFSSPFLRCRQTLERSFPDMPVTFLTFFSEYLGNWRNISRNDFDINTIKILKNFKFERTYKDFKRRIFEGYLQNIIPKPNKDEIFLLVIHGVCLKEWFKIIKANSSYKITLLGKEITDGFKIDTNEDK